ncbi:tetratricopeptide repeat protein [Glycomyces xiaoerkulensis]|uniref:tetratricopeptide repeat protein n=1 Tax=Glycomyces xiaoerkulensis TaxID=2038139 RepID=UPI000C26B51C|nr:tetratricopeptide repeat protein [Glycomyces xiaoerkulensis]
MEAELSPFQHRSVHIVAARHGDRFSLTGFVIAESLVLTCAHDIVDAETIEVHAPSTEPQMVSAEVAWRSDELDVAVLTASDLAAPIFANMAWGYMSGMNRAVAAYGYGFPGANRDGTGDGPASGFHVARIDGEIVPGEGIERRRLVYQIAPGQVPDDETWGGVSGMAVLNEQGRLLGVVASRLTGWHTRWELVPASAISEAYDLPEQLRSLPRRTIDEPDPLLQPAYHLQSGQITDLKLLNPRYGLVDFVEDSHQGYLDRLLAWCEDESSHLSISVLTGPAGSGKTRLAAQLCTTLLGRSDNWNAGFAKTESDERWLTKIPQTPTLAVFDYIERRQPRQNLTNWLRQLDAELDVLPPVRILLISRTQHGWLEEVDSRSQGLIAALHQPENDADLGVAGASNECFGTDQRRRHAEAAYQQFIGDDEPDEQRLPDLLEFVAADQVDSPLLVHISALLAARGKPLPNSANNGKATDRKVQAWLLDQLLRRERQRRWSEHDALSHAGASPATSDEALHAIGIANLTQPDRHELEHLLTGSPLWAPGDTTAAQRRAACQAIYVLYPGPDRTLSDQRSTPTIAPIEPDLISEHLIASIDSSDLTAIIRQLLTLDLRSGHLDRMLHVANLMSGYYPNTRHLFDDTVDHFLRQTTGLDEITHDATEQILATRLPYLVETVVMRAVNTGEPAMPNLLITVLRRYEDSAELARAAANLEFDFPDPAPNHQVNELRFQIALLASRQLESTGSPAELADGYFELGSVLLRLDRHAEALPYTQQAVEYFRSLGEGDADHLPRLAAAVNNIGAALFGLGRHTEALPYLEEATERFQGSADDELTDRPKLAYCLANRGAALVRLGRYAEATLHSRQAVDNFQAMAEDDPAQRPGLAHALNMAGTGLDEQGRHAEARPYLQDSVKLYRRLVEDNPAHRPGLARALGNLSICLGEVGDEEDALELRWEAVGLCRQLALDDPAHRPDLASALCNLSALLARFGRHSEALPHIQEAVEAYRLVVESNEAHKPELANALNLLGAVFIGLDRPNDALAPSRESVDMYRELAENNPRIRLRFARALDNLSAGLEGINQRAEAQEYRREAVDLYRELAEANPTHQPQLAQALNSLGITLAGLGRPADAGPCFQEAADLYEILAEHDQPHQASLAHAVGNISATFIQLGDPATALPYLQRTADLYKRLAESDAAHLPHHAKALSDLGTAHAIQRNHAVAQEHLQRAAELYQPLVAEQSAYRPDLANTLANLGVTVETTAGYAAAVPYLKEAVRLYWAEFTNHPLYLVPLVQAIRKLCGGLSNLGRIDEARHHLREALERIDAIVADDPTWRQGLRSLVHSQLTTLEEPTESPEPPEPGGNSSDQ